MNKKLKLPNSNIHKINFTCHTGELSKYDMKNFTENNIKWAVYYYVNWGYEGQGQILMRKNKKWYLHDLGHCSCYGPLDQLTLKNGYTSFNKIYKNITGTWLNEVIPLIDFAKEHKKEWK